MNIIKSMIIKDLTVSKKVNICSAIVLVIIIAMAFLFRFAYIYGNLADHKLYESAQEMHSMLNYFDIFVPFMLSAAAAFSMTFYINTAVADDFKCRWYSVLYSAGKVEYSAAAARLIEMIISVICAMAVNFAVNAVYAANFPTNYSKTVLLIGSVAVPMIVGALQSVCFALTLKFKKTETVSAIMLVAVICAAGLLSRKIIKALENASDNSTEFAERIGVWAEENLAVIIGVSVIAFVVIGIISFFVSAMLFKRGDRICGD